MSELRTIALGAGRHLRATPIFDTYWRFACERQRMFMRRVEGRQPPWTDDPIIASHRFTNAYRASDRVSQHLIRHVIYDGDQSPDELFFRILLFKIFNKVETWTSLVDRLGAIEWRSFDLPKYETELDRLMGEGSIYSAAYIMPSPKMGATRKHGNHLRLLAWLMKEKVPAKLVKARSLEEVFQTLRSYPSFGDFLAFQFTMDLNYSTMIDFSEMDFVVAGPGACDGIRKCFEPSGLTEAQVIHAVTEMAESEFARLGLEFQTLWGRPLQLIDCQNLFCETDKYARVAHPEAPGKSGRTKIKQAYDTQPSRALAPPWFPPKWGLTVGSTPAT